MTPKCILEEGFWVPKCPNCGWDNLKVTFKLHAGDATKVECMRCHDISDLSTVEWGRI